MAALLDSAILYEAIKPVTRQLRIITNLQNNEINLLRHEIRLQAMQTERERKEREAAVRVAGRKGFWRGFGWCGLIVVTAEVAIIVIKHTTL